MTTNIETKSESIPSEKEGSGGKETQVTVNSNDTQGEESKKHDNKQQKNEESKKKEEIKEEKGDSTTSNNTKKDSVQKETGNSTSSSSTNSNPNSNSTSKKEGKKKEEKRIKDSDKEKGDKKDSQTQASSQTQSQTQSQSQGQSHGQSKKEEKKEGKKWEVKDHKKVEKKEEPTTTLSRVNESGKHLLESSWTFWYDKKQANKKPGNSNYEDNLVQLGSFNTLEEFWNLYTHLKRPTELSKECNYQMFRAGMKPMWESFPKGGCFIKKVRKADPSLNRMWEELLFATIGEAFEDPDVVGVVLSTRPKEDILSIWNMDHQNQGLRSKIGEKLKEIWELDPNTPIEYKNHSASMKDKNTYHSHVKQFFV